MTQQVKINNASERKLEIALKALELFAARGYGNTSVDEITEACGMSKGNFYYYFDSKEELVYVIRDWSVKEFDRESRLLEEKIAALGPRAALRHYFTAYVHNVNTVIDAYNFLNHVIISLEPAGRKRLMQGSDDVMALFEKILLAGVADGVFQINNVKLAARNITRMGTDWAHSHWHFRRFIDMPDYIRQQIEYFEKAIC